MGNVQWPAGAADLQEPDYGATLAVTVTQRLTILKPAILTGDMTINLTIDDEVPIGSMLLHIQAATANSDDVTYGTGIDGPNLVGVAGKTKTSLFIYDGVSFKQAGAMVQLD